MKRNVIATVKFTSSEIALTVLERLPNSVVELYNASGKVNEAKTFLAKALGEVAQRIGGKLVTVSIVIEPTPSTNAQITLHRERLPLDDMTVSQQDIANLTVLTRRHFSQEHATPILIQPLRFEVEASGANKAYWRAPIGKSGTALTQVSAVTTIDNNAYDYLVEVVKSQHLEINQMFLSAQVLAHAHLSTNALVEGAVLLHVADHQSFVTICKNTATVAHQSFLNLGFDKLVNGVVKVFGASAQEARDLLAAYGTLETTAGDQIIYSRSSGLSEETYTSADLTAIIHAYGEELLSAVANFLAARHLKSSLPLIISGKVWKITGVAAYVKDRLHWPHVSLYNPLSFVEVNEQNAAALGALKFMMSIDEMLGRQFNTIIETNPNTLATLTTLSQQRKWFSKFWTKIGGHYDWK